MSGLPTFTLGREVTGLPAVSNTREWLVTNSLGGYACGTVSGALTRRYHGLLVAALKPPLARTLLLASLDATAHYDGTSYPLFRNHWEGGRVDPEGDRYLQSFSIYGTTPAWIFACGDLRLEKRVWMAAGANTTYVHYRHLNGSRPVTLEIKAVVNFRDHHGSSRGRQEDFEVAAANHGARVSPSGSPSALFLLSEKAEFVPGGAWFRNYHLAAEAYRGLDAVEDHFFAGSFRVELHPGEEATLVASTAESVLLDGAQAAEERQSYERDLMRRAGLDTAPEWVNRLALAADQFIVARHQPDTTEGSTIIAGYPWFSDWGRDTMISLPGLTLATRRPQVARSILATYGSVVDKGMLPNRFPEQGEAPEFNTVDATLWYFEALRAYHEATGDDELVSSLFPVLEEIIDWHLQGTRFAIQVDPTDGLLRAGETGVQLTWMDAKVGDWVVTPRTGKPVEINALWYQALRVMARFASHLRGDRERYETLAGQARAGFERFWNPATGYCYDVLDGPQGDDPTLRPNQLLAVSLTYSPLSEERQRGVVAHVTRRLVCSAGLRSLDPSHQDYLGAYGGGPVERDGAYHQGTVWAWLIGPFISAHLRVYKNPAQASAYLLPFRHHMADHGLNTVSEIFDGDPPHTPRGCFAQAWSVAEVLRAWREIDEFTRASG